MSGGQPTFSIGIHAMTAEECWFVRQLVIYLNGRQKAIYVATHRHDLELSRDTTAGNSSIYVVDRGFYEIFLEGYITNLMLFSVDGLAPREVTAVVKIPETGEEQITLADTVGGSYDVGDLKISHLPLCRLDSDVVNIEWISELESYTMLEIIGVKE